MGALGMSKSSTRNVELATIESPWRNIYWFARMLINNDKYGGVGKDSKLLAQITAQIRSVLELHDSDENKILLSQNIIKSLIEERFKGAKAVIDRARLFCKDVNEKIKSIEDIIVFIITAESIMIPINNALVGIPSDDKAFTEATAKAYLDSLGPKGLATVINLWDDLGVTGCLNAERAAVMREFTHLRSSIGSIKLDEIDENLVLTAFMQEFERRLSQKRKARAGGSLEDVASFLFNYYKIKASHAPDHFQADIEVDKWIKCDDGWLIGISCKRTLRERWKQVSSADRGVLSKYKIKNIWHLITYDEDLSDDKITTLGNQGHIFYLRDDSRIFEKASKHVGMKEYVRKSSSLIEDIKEEITR
jgi:rRNA maturation protein Rpf1